MLTNLEDETAQKIMDCTNASLYIEFVLVAADIIGHEKLKISDKTIKDWRFELQMKHKNIQLW